MAEYITRNNAVSAVCFGCNIEFSDEPCEPDVCKIRQSIMDLPAADVVEVKEARWKGAGMGDYICSLCWEVSPSSNELKYCPHCGAKMDVPDTNVGEKEGDQ